jgi:very-short-patch-repair endonuclease
MSRGPWKNNPDVYCIECKRKFKWSGLNTHYLRTHIKDTRFLNSGWKKGDSLHPKQNGYTKNKDYELSPESRLKLAEAKRGKTLSEETKKKISNSRIEFLKKNPDKIPYKLNHSSTVSYPETYFIQCLESVKDNKECQYKVHTYKLDFANPAEKLYLEIDGDQHYLDSKMVEHDKRRYKILHDLGWRGIRVRWSSFQKLSDEEKKQEIEKIIVYMRW